MEYKWITNSGKTIAVPDLNFHHLSSIIKCMYGKGNSKIPDPYLGLSIKRWLCILEEELHKRKLEFKGLELQQFIFEL